MNMKSRRLPVQENMVHLIVFYKPYMLFVDKKGKEAGQLVLSTAKWLGIFLALIIATVAVTMAK